LKSGPAPKTKQTQTTNTPSILVISSILLNTQQLIEKDLLANMTTFHSNVILLRMRVMLMVMLYTCFAVIAVTALSQTGSVRAKPTQSSLSAARAFSPQRSARHSTASTGSFGAGYCGKAPGNTLYVSNDQWKKILKRPQLPHGKPANASSSLTLRQVTVLIRHGDRVNSGHCWANDTAKFECNLRHASVPVDDPTSLSMSVNRLYRKVYIQNREDNADSNCGSFQLTSNGYEQQLRNGQILRSAYTGDGNLLPTEYSNKVAGNYLLRTDDVPRTILSAESLFLGYDT
jgi:Histidine phosphatase superfamily (branch 2)